MNLETIEVKKLSKSPLNVRKTDSEAACEELKASLLAHGLMQNLTAYPGKEGGYLVVAGARRMAALQSLVADGHLPEGHAVPCLIVTEAEARELSLAENTARLAMHPADEFEAFNALAEQGRTAEQIGQRFGKSTKHVLQRMKLGKVAPDLMAEFRAGAIKLEALMAFTVTDDREKQMAVYRSLNSWEKDNAQHIRRCLTEGEVSSKDKLANFVGPEAYQAAGGRTRADLFADQVYLEDTALLHRLAGEKLEAEAEKLRAEGWGWVEVSTEGDRDFVWKCGRIEATPLDAPEELNAEKAAIESAMEAMDEEWDAVDEDDEEGLNALRAKQDGLEKRLEAVDEKLDAYVAFDPEQLKLAGCFVSVGHNGTLSVERGLVKPEDKKAIAKSASSGESADEPATEDKAGLPQSLVKDLEAYRTQVAQVAMAENPAIAFDLLVMAAARKVLQSRPVYDGADVAFHQSHPSPSTEEKTAAAGRLASLKEALPLDWLKEKTEPAQLVAFQLLDQADKLRLLAYCTAMTLRPKLAPAEGRQKTVYDAALERTGASVAAYWRPTAANFLGRIKAAQLLEIGREVFGDSFPARWAKAKKSELVAALDRGFSKPEQDERPDVQERLKRWLPAGMEIAAEMAGPVAEAEPVRKKRGRKAA